MEKNAGPAPVSTTACGLAVAGSSSTMPCNASSTERVRRLASAGRSSVIVTTRPSRCTRTSPVTSSR